jgi:hypothetical protein
VGQEGVEGVERLVGVMQVDKICSPACSTSSLDTILGSDDPSHHGTIDFSPCRLGLTITTSPGRSRHLVC